jgi:hypothetical protein
MGYYQSQCEWRDKLPYTIVGLSRQGSVTHLSRAVLIFIVGASAAEKNIVRCMGGDEDNGLSDFEEQVAAGRFPALAAKWNTTFTLLSAITHDATETYQLRSFKAATGCRWSSCVEE